MARGVSTAFVPVEAIEAKILTLRGQRVIWDRVLAELYGVKPIALRQQVRRNLARFPKDFMFQVSAGELSQIVIPPGVRLGGGLPFVFTQEGVSMLSSVLRSKRAVEVNIGIVRAFVRMRSVLADHADLRRKIDDMETRYDDQFHSLFKAIRQLMEPPVPPRKRRIGFAAAVSAGGR